MTNYPNFEIPDLDGSSTDFMSWEEFQTADGMQKKLMEMKLYLQLDKSLLQIMFLERYL